PARLSVPTRRSSDLVERVHPAADNLLEIVNKLGGNQDAVLRILRHRTMTTLALDRDFKFVRRCLKCIRTVVDLAERRLRLQMRRSEEHTSELQSRFD